MDQFLGSLDDACDAYLPELPTDAVPDAFRFCSLPTVDVTEEGEYSNPKTMVWMCRGWRDLEETVITKHPLLLSVAAATTGLFMRGKPDKIITFGDFEYDVAAVIYTNEHRSHFYCHVFVQGNPLFYDGMAKRKMRWQASTGYEKSNFPISEVWYRRTQRRVHKSSGNQRSVLRTSISLSDSCTISNEPSMESNRGNSDKPGSNTQKKRRKIPFGVSAQLVSLRGPLPTCHGCNVCLERDTFRIVLKTHTNPEKGWYATKSFHMDAKCCEKHLNDSQMTQAKDLIG